MFENKSFEHVESWAKILHSWTHYLWNSTNELTLNCSMYFAQCGALMQKCIFFCIVVLWWLSLLYFLKYSLVTHHLMTCKQKPIPYCFTRSVNLERKFWCLQLIQKNELENFNVCLSLLGFVFWKNGKTKKSSRNQLIFSIYTKFSPYY